jgi:hypothetical protein
MSSRDVGCECDAQEFKRMHVGVRAQVHRGCMWDWSRKVDRLCSCEKYSHRRVHEHRHKRHQSDERIMHTFCVHTLLALAPS